jgi:hypothetical protein
MSTRRGAVECLPKGISMRSIPDPLFTTYMYFFAQQHRPMHGSLAPACRLQFPLHLTCAASERCLTLYAVRRLGHSDWKVGTASRPFAFST